MLTVAKLAQLLSGGLAVPFVAVFTAAPLLFRLGFSVQIHNMEDEDDPSLDEDFPLGDGIADMETIVRCPYCGEDVEMSVDPGGGSSQSYVEDCPVCCSPWMVQVHYDAEQVHVTLTQLDA